MESSQPSGLSLPVFTNPQTAVFKLMFAEFCHSLLKWLSVDGRWWDVFKALCTREGRRGGCTFYGPVGLKLGGLLNSALSFFVFHPVPLKRPFSQVQAPDRWDHHGNT